MSNIGGCSKATLVGGVALMKGMKAMLQYTTGQHCEKDGVAEREEKDFR